MAQIDKIIEVTGLHKSYGSIHAVKGIDFYVEKGKLFAFLGPNGAGKSTTIDMLCTFLRPDSGEVVIDGSVLGHDDDDIRSKIGVVFQSSYLDPLLTVRENLMVRGSFYGLDKKRLSEAIAHAAKVTAIEELLNRPYGNLSGGQRRRADIARSLINTPKVLFLDEPTTGLDPQTRLSVWNTIKAMQKDTGMTVFLTTHYMEEASEADYVIVIDDGLVAAKGTPNALKDSYANDLLKLTPRDMPAMKQKLDSLKLEYSEGIDYLAVKISDTVAALPILSDVKDNVLSFEVLRGTMDDAFIGITGKGIRE